MLSYLHHYHAGNFADVHKHIALIAVLTALRRKDVPFMILDTHAGRGLYDFLSLPEEPSAEYHQGIAKLWDLQEGPAILTSYLDVVRASNPDGQLRYYPGSPLIARYFLRSRDCLQLLELHPSEHQRLRQLMHEERRAAVHRRDAYEGLNALLPPKESRGLALIDPSYEVKSELTQLMQALSTAWRHWRHGVYLIWYPLLPSNLQKRIQRALALSPFEKIWHCELEVKSAQSSRGLYGSGIALLNPPWQVPEQLGELLPLLASKLSQGSSSTRQQWLRGTS